MNHFVASAAGLIKYHGTPCSYVSVNSGAYNVETGSVDQVKVITPVVLYPKQINATAYNFPDLIGKEAVMFYMSKSSLSPSLNDEIIYSSKQYKVQSYQEHFAQGEIALYRIIAVRG